MQVTFMIANAVVLTNVVVAVLLEKVLDDGGGDDDDLDEESIRGNPALASYDPDSSTPSTSTQKINGMPTNRGS